MNIIQIREAEREGARLVIGLAGISGSGKTYTALQLAYGLANYDAKKVGFLDTENKRGSLYADTLKNSKGEIQKFLIGDLYAPFSPDRYIQAIQEFQKAGVEVLVIDSVTHEWEGNGGCEDIAHQTIRKTPDWIAAKREHKRFMSALLQCDMHVIVCIRAREKVSIENQSGKTVFIPQGVQPVQEKNFMFEMTASLMMHAEGAAQDVLKCPSDLKGILGRTNGYIAHEDGKALRSWVDGAKQLNPKVEAYKNRLQSVTENGSGFIKNAWSQVPKDIQTELGEGFKAQLFASAEAFDGQGSEEDERGELLKRGGE